MKVYELNADGRGRWVWFFPTADSPLLPRLAADSQLFFESRPRIRIVRNNETKTKGKNESLADFSNVGYSQYPCFSERAKEVLALHIDKLGQWLALDCDEIQYWLFNVTNEIDSLDVDASKILYFSDQSKVMRIEEFAFHAGKLKGQLLFSLPQRACTLVTQEFVDLVYRYGLTGFMFRLLWSSEQGAVSGQLKDYERPRVTGLEPR